MSQKKQPILICAQWGGDSNGSARQTPKAVWLGPGIRATTSQTGCKRKCFDIWVIDGGRLGVGALAALTAAAGGGEGGCQVPW